MYHLMYDGMLFLLEILEETKFLAVCKMMEAMAIQINEALFLTILRSIMVVYLFFIFYLSV